MRVWLYYRLSNDDDKAQNSLQNQRNLCAAYAAENSFTVIGESFDDNVSGMHFQRDGIQMLTAAALNRQMDAVLVKDLSRLGRHRIQTALFLDFLREQNVRVLSATEQFDTFEEKDDLTIGVRGLLNDLYARDIGKKVRAGYRQKQKAGLVITPPFGYWKDRNTDEIQILEEAAQTVRLIYSLFLQDAGLKEIARRLNTQGCKTPVQLQQERYGKAHPQIKQYRWSYTSVKNVLTDESYTGVLSNHKRETRNGVTSVIPPEKRYHHADFYPVIVPTKAWQEVQALLAQRTLAQCGTDNRPKHRYAGLLMCRACGSPFVPLRRCWNGNCRIEYVCKGYHRYGREACASHRVHENVIDHAVWERLNRCHADAMQARSKIKELQKIRALRKPILDARIYDLEKRQRELEREIEDILLEKCKLKGEAAIY